MIVQRKILPILLIWTAVGLSVGSVNYAHHELPPLYNFDDYDLCFEKGNSKLASTYCMVYTEVIPQNSSELWQKIAAHTNTSKFHYHHDRLFFGMCMERCLNFMPSTDQTDPLTNSDDLLNNEITQFFEQVHKRPLDKEMRMKYGSMIQNCLNDEFERKYNLKVRTFIEYCEGRKVDNPVEKDLADSVLYKLFEIIILLVVLSTIYDYSLRSREPEEDQTNEFFKNNLEEPTSRFLTSFSLNRNYYRLVQPYRGEIGKEFAYLDGFRWACTLLVLHAHTFYLQYQHVGNPEYFEQFSYSLPGLMILNTTTFIEIFMVMSGLLLYIKFTDGRYVTPQTSWKKCIRIYGSMVVSRLMRFLPSVALGLLVNATVLTRLGDGPFWRHIVEPSRVFSRENWWKNLLMINNFSQKDTVSSHTWYIAADFQLFAIYTLILIVLAKYPQYKNRVLSTLAILAVAVPTVVSFILKLEPGVVIKPESYRFQFFIDFDAFYYLYTPSITNLGGYLFGIFCGDVYLNHIRDQGDVRKRLLGRPIYELGGWIALPIAAGISAIGSRLIFNEPSIWTALFNGLYRNLWIVFTCGIPLLGMACKGGMMAYDFCCLPIFRVLARLSFQVYLWHILVLQVTTGYQRKPYHMNRMHFNGQAMITIFYSVIIAFFICLLIEYPIAQCVDLLQPKKTRSLKELSKETKVE